VRPFSLVGSAYSVPDQDLIGYEQEVLSGRFILQYWSMRSIGEAGLLGSMAQRLCSGGGSTDRHALVEGDLGANVSEYLRRLGLGLTLTDSRARRMLWCEECQNLFTRAFSRLERDHAACTHLQEQGESSSMPLKVFPHCPLS
jgi:hypothetical protein